MSEELANSYNDTEKKDFPQELMRFNWGAFLLNWIWGVMHKKYITLLTIPAMIIPFFGPLVLSIWFGFAGNKWAWESKDWLSVDEFNETQKMWVRLWFVIVLFVVLLFIKILIVLFFILSAIGQSAELAS